MRVFDFEPRSSDKVLEQLADHYKTHIENGLIEAETEEASIQAQALELNKWIDVSIIKTIANQKTHIVRRAIPEHDRVLFTLSNFSTHILNEEAMSIKKVQGEDQLFITNNQHKTEIDLVTNVPLQFITFRVHKDQLLKYTDLKGSKYYDYLQKDEPFSLNQFLPVKMHRLMQKLFEFRPDIGTHSLRLHAQAFELISDCIQLMCQNSPVVHKDFNQTQLSLVFGVQSYILQNIGETLELDGIAEHFHISKSKLLKVFKKVTGDTPYQYVLKERLKKSQDLLKQSDQTITQITFDLGFNSPSHFTACFKKEFGLTPAVFKKKMSE